MEEVSLELKQQFLDKIKAKYEEFYNKNAAVNPDSVKKIEYFLNFLKDKVTAEDLVVTKDIVHVRSCEADSKIKYFLSFGGGQYSDYSYVTQTFSFYLVDSHTLSGCFSDVYYNEQANTKIVPKELSDIVKERSKKGLISHEYKRVYSDSEIVRYTLSDPEEQEYYVCEIHYDYPVADKDGNTKKVMKFAIWDDLCPIILEPKKYPEEKVKKGGCYVATAVYGSYDCPEVWTLRRYRDNTLASTWYGRAFIHTYYAISPTIVKWFGKTKWFNRMWKGKLDKMVKKLNDEGVENTPYNDKNW